jgi:hypothetical protein
VKGATESRRLLDRITRFVAGLGHSDVERSRSNLGQWDGAYRAVAPRMLPAADRVPMALPLASDGTRELLGILADARHRLRWEQTYTADDGWVGEAMIAGYAWTDVVGANGPFVSERIRVAFAMWGPHIDYPPHFHEVEEIYVVLAGSASFRLAGGVGLNLTAALARTLAGPAPSLRALLQYPR